MQGGCKHRKREKTIEYLGQMNSLYKSTASMLLVQKLFLALR